MCMQSWMLIPHALRVPILVSFVFVTQVVMFASLMMRLRVT